MELEPLFLLSSEVVSHKSAVHQYGWWGCQQSVYLTSLARCTLIYIPYIYSYCVSSFLLGTEIEILKLQIIYISLSAYERPFPPCNSPNYYAQNVSENFMSNTTVAFLYAWNSQAEHYYYNYINSMTHIVKQGAHIVCSDNSNVYINSALSSENGTCIGLMFFSILPLCPVYIHCMINKKYVTLPVHVFCVC